MDFTSLYSSTSSILSPSSSLLLTATSGFLVLRDAASFQVLQSWRTGSPSSKPWTQLSFSADSRFCLASDTEAGIVEVYAVDEEKAVVSVKAGSEGLMGVRWLEGSSGGPRLIACWARHGLRMTIWDIETGKQYHIQNPKRGPSAGWAINPYSQDTFALLERHKGRDHLGIYDLETLTLIRHFPLATSDAQDVSWSPCGRYLAIWDSCLDYALHIYTPDGRLQHTHTLSQGGISGLGVRSVAWHPSGRFLVVGGYDDTIRILNDISWSVSYELELPGSMWASPASRKGKGKMPVHREPADWLANASASGSIVSFETSLVPCSQLASTSTSTSSKSSSLAPSARELGISSISFSPSGKFLLVHSCCPGLASQALMLRFVRSSPALPYTATRPRLCCIVQTNKPIKRARWRPATAGRGPESCALVSGEKSVLVWYEKMPSAAPAGADEDEDASSDDDAGGLEAVSRPRPGIMEGIAIPSKMDFAAGNVSWAEDGQSMVLQSDKQFCLAYPLVDAPQ